MTTCPYQIFSFFSSGIGRILHVDWQFLLLQSVQSSSGWGGASVHPISVSPWKLAQAHFVLAASVTTLFCLAGVLFCRIWPLSTSGTQTTLTGRSTSPNAGSSSTFWTACGASSKCRSEFYAIREDALHSHNCLFIFFAKQLQSADYLSCSYYFYVHPVNNTFVSESEIRKE